eukprot:CAMPEP_0168471378 /NCGR_PEP_ID=MMETSP0228-20121227/59252_1 /TAXON_ID=133427 /ORGANISM="Protoceratium reticulatum, Strain CCCM 535 (=CCMP 1889)" /LENGTH=46 /DNA_ID= /DNA_START= /DNA_END= /DNA_ORIENTATION=
MISDRSVPRLSSLDMSSRAPPMEPKSMPNSMPLAHAKKVRHSVVHH